MQAVEIFKSVQDAGRKHHLGHEFEFREGRLLAVVFSRFGSNKTLKISREQFDVFDDYKKLLDYELEKFNKILDKQK